ncbi:UNVERIFIED_CONTAM: TonB-dependent receptor, partial [Salmonella enterica subsp. enterica serovar Weltevreden]
MSSRFVRPHPEAIRPPGIVGSLSILLLAACCRCATAQDVADGTDAIELPALRVADSRAPDGANEAGASTLRGEALRERKGATLGETVGDEAGVHNASFGAGVGLPVIRGL